MDAILQFLNEPLAKMLLALVGGWLMKHSPEVSNKLIPVINTVIAVVVALAAGLFGPQDAHAGISSAAKHVGGWFANPFIYGTLISLLTTGVHSTAKNLWQLLKPRTPWSQ